MFRLDGIQGAIWGLASVLILVFGLTKAKQYADFEKTRDVTELVSDDNTCSATLFDFHDPEANDYVRFEAPGVDSTVVAVDVDVNAFNSAAVGFFEGGGAPAAIPAGQQLVVGYE